VQREEARVLSEEVKILLVDDRAENLLALESVLEGPGHTLVRATSGREALRHLLQEDFAVVLLDVHMPELDGFETAELIRSRERSRDTPIIFLTADRADDMHIIRGYSLRAVDYVIKPFDPVILRTKVAVFVELSRRAQALREEVEQRRMAEEEVRRLNSELDRRVRDRTAELTATNRKLRKEISERERAEEERTLLLKQLEQEGRRKDEFLAVLAHELRNPLAAISNAHYALSCLTAENRQVERLRSVIGRQTQKLTRLIDDLLDVSRITRGKITLQKEWLPLSRIVHAAAETCTPLLQQREHRFTLALPEAEVWIYGDQTRLEQVVGNLITNAAKYTEPRGQITLEAMVEERDSASPSLPSGSASPATAVIRVSDSGIGIEHELLPQVFDPFVQAEEARGRAEGGLGIGLALVRDLIRMHDGEVQAYSEGLGCGSVFTLRLPAALGIPTGEPGVTPPAVPAPDYAESGVA
jgi:signal transduction histidine kinase